MQRYGKERKAGRQGVKRGKEADWAKGNRGVVVRGARNDANRRLRMKWLKPRGAKKTDRREVYSGRAYL